MKKITNTTALHEYVLICDGTCKLIFLRLNYCYLCNIKTHRIQDFGEVNTLSYIKGFCRNVAKSIRTQ